MLTRLTDRHLGDSGHNWNIVQNINQKFEKSRKMYRRLTCPAPFP